MKEREEKNSGRKKKVRKKSRTTEFSITVVLCCLVAVLTVKGISLQQKANASRLSSLDSQIEEEKQRTDDITALKEYMQTDEYIEKTAREKLGMVKDNEILFKESQSK